MFCTEKERKTCNAEKMDCEGCYYNKDLEEDIKILEDYIGIFKRNKSGVGLAQRYCNELSQAIENLLNRNKELQIENKTLKAHKNGCPALQTTGVECEFKNKLKELEENCWLCNELEKGIYQMENTNKTLKLKIYRELSGKYVIQANGEDVLQQEIVYCPMCGRKLGGNNER